MAAAVSSVPRLTFLSNAGAPLNGGNVYTYAAGTLTPKTFYSDESKTVPISNPIVLNSAGRPVASATDPTEVNLYYTGSAKFVVKDSSGSTLYTSDNVEEVAVAGAQVIAFPATVTGGVSGGIAYFSSTTALAASSLLTNHAPIIGGGAGAAPKTVAAMTTGQQLFGVTGADPVPAQVAYVSVHPGDPSTTTSSAFVMMGLGGSATITPVVSGRVKFEISGNICNTSLNDSASALLAYGTGTAPINGAAAAGTTVGSTLTFTQAGSGNYQQGFTLQWIVTGLTIGVAYWFDMQAKITSGGTAAPTNITCTAHEI